MDAPGVYAAVMALTFGVTSLAWLGAPAVPGPDLDRDGVTTALLVVGLGMLAFALGAHLVRSDVSARRGEPLALNAPPPLVLCGAYVLALGAVVVGVVYGSYGYDPGAAAGPPPVAAFNQLVRIAPTLAGMVVLMTAVNLLATGDQRLRRPLAGMVVVQTSLGFALGVRSIALESILLVGAAYLLHGRRLPWKAVIVTTGLVLLVLIPVTQSYRDNLTRGPGVHRVSAFFDAVIDPGNLRVDRSVGIAKAYLFQRFRQIDHVALIVAKTPATYGYGNGASYWSLPLFATVPRFMWEDKPTLDVGLQFSYTYWQIPQSIQTVTQVTQVGDLYRNFSLVGVVGGMLLWGAALSWTSKMRRRVESSRLDVVYLYGLVVFVLYVELDLPELIATALKTLPVVAVLAWLLVPGRHGPALVARAFAGGKVTARR